MAHTAGRTDFFRTMVSGIVAAPIAYGIVAPLQTASTLTPDLRTITVFMVFWPIYVAIYLGWSLRTYSLMDPERLRALARRDDQGARHWTQRFAGTAGLFNTVFGAAVSAVIVLVVIAGRDEFRGSPVPLLLGLLSVAGSWALMVHFFAQSYLRLDSAAPAGHHLEHDDDAPPVFTTYLTLATMVSTMGAALPARPRSPQGWRLLRTNTLVAFAFNSVVIAMLASLLLGGVGR